MPPFRNYEHLLRLAALFAVGLAFFFGARRAFVPEDYGLLGAYRATALDENRARPIAYAGQAACAECHADAFEARRDNAHAGVACESCHGPHGAHAADPAVAATRPDGRAICVTCHRADPAKPATFRTVAVEEHADEGACTACHAAHAPKF